MKSQMHVAALALALAGCSGTGIPSDGFKDISYGMTVEQLRGLGFNCRPDHDACTRSGRARPETLFGREAAVAVTTRGGRVARIEASVGLPLSETLSLLRGNFGQPVRLEQQSTTGTPTGIYYWAGDNGTSITVPDSGRSGSSVVQFNDASMTRQFVQQAPTSQVDPNDI